MNAARTVVLVGASVFALALCPAFSQTMSASSASATQSSNVDSQFLQTAASASATEIEASKLAMARSDNQAVKSFAQRMIQDHTKLSLELKAATPRDMSMPKGEPDSSVMDALKPLKGGDFDKVYIEKVGVEGHQQAIKVFEQEASQGQVSAIRKAAQSALPVIRHHYAMAQKLATAGG
jgi:putative membrane protein